MNAAAIILCAGKGTRMNDDSKSKVCFDCAGIPVIRRIIDNMKAGGVSRFVIVVGHQAASVMDTLDGVEGIVYAYQKEQKGTGHAALCGLKALETMGYSGPVIVSMGDKIIAPHVISGLLADAEHVKAVWGVQPLAANRNGGRVVISDGKPCGVVEFADAALLALADIPEEQCVEMLRNIGLNTKKAEKVIDKARKQKPIGKKYLCGKAFGADEILHTPYANAGLYCFDAGAAAKVIGTLGTDNAQGEIYLTDALEVFAGTDDAVLYEMPSAEDMLTYSTKEELREMSRSFMRTVSDYLEALEGGELDAYLREIYGDAAAHQKVRYRKLFDRFLAAYGDQKVIVTRAPGRINLMGRHIDHRGGGINVMATDKDTVFVSAPRKDDLIRMTNTDSAYPDCSFSVKEELSRADHTVWLDYLNAVPVREALAAHQGEWSNYAKGAVLRAQLESAMPLCGMNMAADGTIPVAAGLSSSSSIVVAVMEAAAALNCLNISDTEFINICGEGEWFVGSRGGAGDHAAMKCGKRDKITHLGFKPFSVGESAAFSDAYAVIVANSMIQAKKSEGSKDTFNAKVAAYEFSFMLLKRAYPAYDFREFRDLASVTPYAQIYRMLKTLPEKISREEIRTLLPEYGETIGRIFSTHADPGTYELRGVALYGISECLRAERCMTLLRENDYAALGEMMKISHNGDRIGTSGITDAVLDTLEADNADPALQCGCYGCSTKQIDDLCDLLNGTDGVLGSEIVGAGLGGCVVALVEKEKADGIIAALNKNYYDKFGYEHAANVYCASCGSTILY